LAVTDFRPPQQKRCVVITRVANFWRVSVAPPVTEGQSGLPHGDFGSADEALREAARLAFAAGWSIIDMTGLRSPDELRDAIERAGRDTDRRDRLPGTAA
jgi:hypothetical protein